MKKFLKVLLILICIPVVVLLVAFGFLKFADLNKYKPQIEALALKYANTKIVINGDLDIGVSLKPSIEMNNVEVYMPQQPDEKLANIGTALVQISILPLFNKEIMIDTLQTADTKIFYGDAKDDYVQINELIAEMDSYDTPINLIYDTSVSGIDINGTATLSSLKDLKTTNFDQSQIVLMTNAMGYKIDFSGWINDISTNTNIDGDYDVKYKNSALSGHLNIDLSGEVPSLKLDVNSNKINVPDWTAPKVASSGWLISSAHAEEYIAGTQIPYNYLKMVNADISLNIKKVVVDKDINVDNLQADVNLQNGVFKANIKNAETMGAKVNGQVSLDSPKSLPYLKLNVNSSYIDLQKLTGSTDSQPAKKNADNRSWSLISTAQASELVANTPIPYQYFKMLNADVGINVKKLRVDSEITLEDIIVAAALKNSVFKADIKSLKAGDGSVSGNVSVNAKDQTASANIKAENVILQKLISSYANADNPYLYIQSGGVTNALINVTTSGQNTDAYLANLNGQIIFLVDQSKVRIKSLDRLKGNIIVQILDNLKLNITKQDMKMKCAVMRADISSGVAKFPKGIAFDANDFYIVADGRLNLQNDSLNLSLQPFSGKITDVNISSILGSLLKIKGTITNPKISLNQTETAKSVIGAIASAGMYNVGDMMLSADSAPCYTALSGTVYANHFPAPEKTVTNTVSKGYTNTKESVKQMGKDIKNQAKELKNQAKEIGNQLKGLFSK